MAKKAAIFFATGYEECEALITVDIARRAGIDISMVSVTGVKTVVSSHNVPVVMDKLFDEVDFAELDMMILPGGMPGTKNLEACEPLMDELDKFFKNGKKISAICAAPSVFGHRGYLEGKNACVYPGMETELKGANVRYEPAVTDGNIITGRGMGAAIDFALAIVSALEGEEKAGTIAKAIVYK